MDVRDRDKIEKTQAELDALAKSKKDDEVVETGIKDLEKALAEFGDLEGLFKSKDDDADDKGKKTDPDPANNDGGDEGEDREEDMEKSLSALEQEYVRASEEFGSLRKSVEEGTASTEEKFDRLFDGLGKLTSMTLSLGRGLLGVKKSMDDHFAVLGAKPAGGSGVHLGFGKSRTDDDGDGDRTSVSEARDLLIKAMDEGTLEVPAGLLSRLDVKKDVGIIPDWLRKELNIKA